MKTLLVLLGIVCTATVITETIVAGLLWHRGALSAETVHEIQDILTGANNDIFGDENDDGKKPEDEHTIDLVMEKRVMKILKMEQRMDEMATIKELLEQSRDEILSGKKKLLADIEKFKKERDEARLQDVSEATKKARTIIAKFSPAESVDYLMKLTPEENVTILKGMQDKAIVAILSQFLRGRGKNAVESKARGHQIFEALSVVRKIKGLPAETAKAEDEGRSLQ
jgi:DNA-binding protein